MNKDSDRDIVAIRYNLLNLQDTIQFKNGNEIINHYNTAGQKLQSDYYTSLLTLTPIAEGQVLNPENGYSDVAYSFTGTAYVGNIEYSIYKNKSPGQGGVGWVYANVFTPQRMYNSEGYVDNISISISTLMTNGVRYNYFRKDHLGNNREVWNGVRKNYTGTVKEQASTRQRTQYYPSGLPWASNTGDNPGVQERKYNGKEFVEMHGFDTYDYGARGYYPAMGRFKCVDPLAEIDYSVSPYAYCKGNPINRIDPTGMTSTEEYMQEHGGADAYEREYTAPEDNKENNDNSAQNQKQQTVDCLDALKNSYTGFNNIMQQFAENVLDLFAQKKETTLPDGKKTESYEARDFTPDYVSVDLSGSAYIPFVPSIGGGFDLSLGYVKNDGLFLLGGTRVGAGYDFSITGGLSLGLYTGNYKPSAMSLTGLGAYQTLGIGIFSLGSNQNLTLRNGIPSLGSQWIINSISAGVGLTPVNGSIGISNTFQPYYLYKK